MKPASLIARIGTLATCIAALFTPTAAQNDTALGQLTVAGTISMGSRTDGPYQMGLLVPLAGETITVSACRIAADIIIDDPGIGSEIPLDTMAIASCVSDSLGNYRVYGIPMGTPDDRMVLCYAVDNPDAETYRETISMYGGDAADHPIILTPRSSTIDTPQPIIAWAAVTGSVRYGIEDTGTGPLAGAQVTLYPLGSVTIAIDSGSANGEPAFMPYSTISDEAGNFFIDSIGLIDSTMAFDIVIDHPRYQSKVMNTTIIEGSNDLGDLILFDTIAPPDTNRIDSWITGQVLAAAQPADSNGFVIAQMIPVPACTVFVCPAFVTILPVDSVSIYAGSPDFRQYMAVTDSAGSFTITGIAAYPGELFYAMANKEGLGFGTAICSPVDMRFDTMPLPAVIYLNQSAIDPEPVEGDTVFTVMKDLYRAAQENTSGVITPNTGSGSSGSLLNAMWRNASNTLTFDLHAAGAVTIEQCALNGRLLSRHVERFSAGRNELQLPSFAQPTVVQIVGTAHARATLLILPNR